MGALDDAIREHLELKRRHGASDEEIKQAETEALGPARREPTSVPGETPGIAEEPIAPAPVAGTEAVDDVPPPPPPVAEAPVEPEPVEEHPVEPPRVDDRDDPDRTRTAILDDPMDELAPPDEPPAPPVHHEPGSDEPPAPARPVEPESHDHAAEHAATPPPVTPPGEEDVLEETPDFLQETPEHDRLWFEQKPPRDFDFDE